MIKIFNDNDDQIATSFEVIAETKEGMIMLLPEHQDILFEGTLPKYRISGVFMLQNNNLFLLRSNT